MEQNVALSKKAMMYIILNSLCLFALTGYVLFVFVFSNIPEEQHISYLPFAYIVFIPMSFFVFKFIQEMKKQTLSLATKEKQSAQDTPPSQTHKISEKL